MLKQHLVAGLLDKRRGVLCRLALCALLSAVPYSLFKTGRPFAMPFSAVYTLLLCFIILYILRRQLSAPAPGLILALLMLLTLPGDWGIYAVGWCLAFALLRDQKRAQYALFSLLVLLHFFSVLLPLLWEGAALPELFCRRQKSQALQHWLVMLMYRLP